MKKKRVNKKKFILRIFLLVIILIIVIVLFKLIFKKNDGEEEASLTLIVDNQNVTENLVNDIYIDSNKTLYISERDVKNIFDDNLYFEEESGKLITTSGTKVAAIDVSNNTYELNSATLLLSSLVINHDEEYYIPISDLTNVYNIEVNVTDNCAVISSLYKELITVKTTKKASLKEETSFFSTTIQKIDKEQEIIYLNDADKSGWIKVLTYEGNIGYLKEKSVSDKETKRTNMEEEDFSSNTADVNNAIKLATKSITTENLQNFSSRKKLIEETISNAISEEKYTVNIDLEKVEIDENLLERFIIELIPRLKEIGGSVVVTNNNILSSEFLNSSNM